MAFIDKALIDTIFVRYPEDESEEATDELYEEIWGWTDYDELLVTEDFGLKLTGFQFYLLGFAFSLCLSWVGCCYFFFIWIKLPRASHLQIKSPLSPKRSDKTKDDTETSCLLSAPCSPRSFQEKKSTTLLSSAHEEQDSLIFSEDTEGSEKATTALGQDFKIRSDQEKTAVLIDEFQSLTCLDNMEKKTTCADPKDTDSRSLIVDISTSISGKGTKTDDRTSASSEPKRQSYLNYLKSIQTNMTKSSSALTVEEAATDLLSGDFKVICSKYIIQPSVDHSVSFHSVRFPRQKYDRGKKNQVWRKLSLDSLNTVPARVRATAARRGSVYSSSDHQVTLQKSFSTLTDSTHSIKMQQQNTLRDMISRPRHGIIKNASLIVVHESGTPEDERMLQGRKPTENDLRSPLIGKSRPRTGNQFENERQDLLNIKVVNTKPQGETKIKDKRKIIHRKLEKQREVTETRVCEHLFQENDRGRLCGKKGQKSKSIHKQDTFSNQKNTKIFKAKRKFRVKRIPPSLTEKLVKTNESVKVDPPPQPSAGKFSLFTDSKNDKNKKVTKPKRTSFSKREMGYVELPSVGVSICSTTEGSKSFHHVGEMYPLHADSSKNFTQPADLDNKVYEASHKREHKRRKHRSKDKKEIINPETVLDEGKSSSQKDLGGNQGSKNLQKCRGIQHDNARNTKSEMLEPSQGPQQVERNWSETTSLLNYLMESASKMKWLYGGKEKRFTSVTGAVRRKSVVEKFQPYKIPKYKQNELRRRALELQSSVRRSKSSERLTEEVPRIETTPPQLHQYLPSNQQTINLQEHILKRQLASPSADLVNCQHKPSGRQSDQTQVSQHLLTPEHESVSTERKNIPKTAERLLHHRPRMVQHKIPVSGPISRNLELRTHEWTDAAQQLHSIHHLKQVFSKASIPQGFEQNPVQEPGYKFKVTNQNRRLSGSLELSQNENSIRRGARITYTKLKSKIPQLVTKKETALNESESRPTDFMENKVKTSQASDKDITLSSSTAKTSACHEEPQARSNADGPLKRKRFSHEMGQREPDSSRKSSKKHKSLSNQIKYGSNRAEKDDDYCEQENKSSHENKAKPAREIFTPIKFALKETEIEPVPNKNAQSNIAAMIPLLMSCAQDPIIIIAPEKSIHELGNIAQKLYHPETMPTADINKIKPKTDEDPAPFASPVYKEKVLESPSYKHSFKNKPKISALERHGSQISSRQSSQIATTMRGHSKDAQYQSCPLQEESTEDEKNYGSVLDLAHTLGSLSRGTLRHMCSPTACRLCGTHNIQDTCEMGNTEPMTSHQQYTMNVQKSGRQCKRIASVGNNVGTDQKIQAVHKALDKKSGMSKTAKLSELKSLPQGNMKSVKNNFRHVNNSGQAKDCQFQEKQINGKIKLTKEKSCVDKNKLGDNKSSEEYQGKVHRNDDTETEPLSPGLQCESNGKRLDSNLTENENQVNVINTSQSITDLSETQVSPSKSDTMHSQPTPAHGKTDAEKCKNLKTYETVKYKHYRYKEGNHQMLAMERSPGKKRDGLPGYLKFTKSYSAKRYHQPRLARPVSSKTKVGLRDRLSPTTRIGAMKQFRAEGGDLAYSNKAMATKPPPLTKSNQDGSFERFTAVISPTKTRMAISPLMRKTVQHNMAFNTPSKIGDKREAFKDRPLPGSNDTSCGHQLLMKASGTCEGKELQTARQREEVTPDEGETRMCYIPVNASKINFQNDNMIPKSHFHNPSQADADCQYLQPPKRVPSTKQTESLANELTDAVEISTQPVEQMKLKVKQTKTSLERRRRVTQQDWINKIAQTKNSRYKIDSHRKDRKDKNLPMLSSKFKINEERWPKVPQRHGQQKGKFNTRFAEALKPNHDNKQQSHARQLDTRKAGSIPSENTLFLSHTSPKVSTSSKSRVSLNLSPNVQYAEVECPEESSCRRTKIVLALSNEAEKENLTILTTKSKKDTDWTTLADVTDCPQSSPQEAVKIDKNQSQYLSHSSPYEFNNLVKIEPMTSNEAEEFCLPDKMPKKINTSSEESERSLKLISCIDKEFCSELAQKVDFGQDDEVETRSLVASTNYETNKHESFKYKWTDNNGNKNTKTSFMKDLLENSFCTEPDREPLVFKENPTRNEMQKECWLEKISLTTKDTETKFTEEGSKKRARNAESDPFQRKTQKVPLKKMNNSDPVPSTNVPKSKGCKNQKKTESKVPRQEHKNRDIPDRDPQRLSKSGVHYEIPKTTPSKAKVGVGSSKKQDIKSQNEKGFTNVRSFRKNEGDLLPSKRWNTTVSFSDKETQKEVGNPYISTSFETEGEKGQFKLEDQLILDNLGLSQDNKTPSQSRINIRCETENASAQSERRHQSDVSLKDGMKGNAKNRKIPSSKKSTLIVNHDKNLYKGKTTSLRKASFHGQTKSRNEEGGNGIRPQLKDKKVRSILQQPSGRHLSDKISRQQNESAQSSAEVHVSWMADSYNLDMEENNQLGSSYLSLKQQQVQSSKNNSDLVPLSTMWGFQDEAATLFSLKDTVDSSQLLDTANFLSHSNFAHEDLLTMDSASTSQMGHDIGKRLLHVKTNTVSDGQAVSLSTVNDEGSNKTGELNKISPKSNTEIENSKIEPSAKSVTMGIGFPAPDRRRKQTKGGLGYRAKLRPYSALAQQSKSRTKGGLFMPPKSRSQGRRVDDKTTNNIKSQHDLWMDGWLQGAREVEMKKDKSIEVTSTSKEQISEGIKQCESTQEEKCYFGGMPVLLPDSLTDYTKSSATETVFNNDSGPAITVKFQKQHVKTVPLGFQSRLKVKSTASSSPCSQNVTTNNNQVQPPFTTENSRTDSDEKESENAVPESRIKDMSFNRRYLQDHMGAYFVPRSPSLEGQTSSYVDDTSHNNSQNDNTHPRTTVSEKSDESTVSQVSFDWYKPSTSTSSISSHMNGRRFAPGQLFNRPSFDNKQLVTATRRHISFVDSRPLLLQDIALSDTTSQRKDQNGQRHRPSGSNHGDHHSSEKVSSVKRSTQSRVNSEFQDRGIPQLSKCEHQNSHRRAFSPINCQGTINSMNNTTKPFIHTSPSSRDTPSSHSQRRCDKTGDCRDYGNQNIASVEPQRPIHAYYFRGNKQQNRNLNLSGVQMEKERNTLSSALNVHSPQNDTLSNQPSSFNRNALSPINPPSLPQNNCPSSRSVHYFRTNTPGSENSQAWHTEAMDEQSTGALEDRVYQRPMTGFSYLYNDTVGNEDYQGSRSLSLPRRVPGSTTLRVRRPDHTTMVGRIVKMFEKKLQLRPPP